MIREYVRNRKNNIIGVVVADERDSNVFVGSSLVHPKDMTDKQKKNGLNRKERNEATQFALNSTPLDLSDIDNIHSSLHKILPNFLLRVGACYQGAFTINDEDITPYKPDFTERSIVCNKLADNLQAINLGISKLIGRLRSHEANTQVDNTFEIAKDAAIIVLIERLIASKITLDGHSLLEFYSKRKQVEMIKTVDQDLEARIVETFGELARPGKCTSGHCHE